MTFVILSYVFTLILFLTKGYTIDDNFDKCDFKNEDLDRCLAASIEKAIRTVGSHGIPAMNFPPIDPVRIASVEIATGTTAVNLAQNYSDVKIYGLSDIVVESAHLDLNGKSLSFTSLHPEIRQEAKYSMSGKIFVVPVNGRGNSKISLYKPSLKHTLIFEEKTKNNRKFFNIVNYTLKISIQGAHLEFQNLYNGDKKMSQDMMKIVNDNWDVMFDDVRSDVEKSSAEVSKILANKFFDNVPVDQIFIL